MLAKTLIPLCMLVAAGLLPLRSHGADLAADGPTPVTANDPGDARRWSAQGQFTNVTQLHPRFTAPYSGTNSLDANRSTKETSDLTAYLGFRPWRGTDFWLNPEVDQGFGLSSTVGVAGFPSGEAYKVGADAPYLRIPRAFARHVFALDSAEEHVDAATNQFEGSHPVNNVTVTIGKFSAVDLFDNDTYAHDPRNDFMNWSIIDVGAFDYAADAWGFTYGGAVEWTQDFWTGAGRAVPDVARAERQDRRRRLQQPVRRPRARGAASTDGSPGQAQAADVRQPREHGELCRRGPQRPKRARPCPTSRRCGSARHASACRSTPSSR